MLTQISKGLSTPGNKKIVAENGNKLLPETGNGNIVAAPVKVAVSGNNLLPFLATKLPGVDRP